MRTWFLLLLTLMALPAAAGEKADRALLLAALPAAALELVAQDFNAPIFYVNCS